jgi:hypothetical protein
MASIALDPVELDPTATGAPSVAGGASTAA